MAFLNAYYSFLAIDQKRCLQAEDITAEDAKSLACLALRQCIGDCIDVTINIVHCIGECIGKCVVNCVMLLVHSVIECIQSI